MTHLSPALYRALQRPAAAREAEALRVDWDARLEAVRRQYERAAPSLPEAFRRFWNEVCLHDAVVVAADLTRDPPRPDALPAPPPDEAPPGRGATGHGLTVLADRAGCLFTLAFGDVGVEGAARFVRLLRPGRALEWLYEEVDAIPAAGGGEAVPTLSILLSRPPHSPGGEGEAISAELTFRSFAYGRVVTPGAAAARESGERLLTRWRREAGRAAA